MYAAARLYYDEGLTPHGVAQRLSVSRSTVSRLLQLARDNDIVRIEVRAPSPAASLSADLSAELGLKRAVVVPAQGARAGLQALVAPALGELGRTGLAADDVLAVSWGTTVWEIAQAQRLPSLRGVRLVPAVGGMDERDVRFQPNEIARRVAAASGAEVSFLHAPALPAADLRRSLLSDPQIAERLDLWNRIPTALVGLGMPPHGAPGRAPPGARGRPRRGPGGRGGAPGGGRRRRIATLEPGRRAGGSAEKGQCRLI